VTPSHLEAKLTRRSELITKFLTDLSVELSRDRRGPLHDEICTQQKTSGWYRATTPLESGWHSTLQQMSAAIGHATVFIERINAPDHFATGDLLVRAALENLSLVAWLLDETASVSERSIRALSEVNYSTGQLKKLYRSQGRNVGNPPFSPEIQQLVDALDDIKADIARVGGADTKVSFPPRINLIELLFGGPEKPDENGLIRGSIYRFLSPTSHGTKWSMRHYTSPPSNAGLVSTLASVKHTEMLLFYLGMAILGVSASATTQLHWVDLSEGGQQFVGLGLSEIDYDS